MEKKVWARILRENTISESKNVKVDINDLIKRAKWNLNLELTPGEVLDLLNVEEVSDDMIVEEAA